MTIIVWRPSSAVPREPESRRWFIADVAVHEVDQPTGIADIGVGMPRPCIVTQSALNDAFNLNRVQRRNTGRSVYVRNGTTDLDLRRSLCA